MKPALVAALLLCLALPAMNARPANLSVPPATMRLEKLLAMKTGHE
jgi:hypothetical protein